MQDSLASSISKALLRHALRACPPGREKWIAAAAAELESITGSYESLMWSLGAVYASYQARLSAMSLDQPQLSGPVLTLEALICFFPSSLLWGWVLLAVAKDQIPASGGLYLFAAASIGPMGLVAFGRMAIGNCRSTRGHGALTLILLAGWTAAAILLSPLTPMPLMDLAWRDCVLLVLLPLIGVMHYMHLARKSRSIHGRNT